MPRASSRISHQNPELPKCRRPQTVFSASLFKTAYLRLTPSRILLTKCGVASRRLAARSSVIHPTTAARLRHPDRTTGRPSAGGSPSGGYSPLHCCPPPAARPHHRGCELGGMRTACGCVVV